MRTKKLFSLLLAVLMLCSLSVSAFAAETAQASVPVVLTVVNSVSPISVSVPACLPVTVLDGYVVTASNAVIENRAQNGAVQVVAVDVQPGAFAIGDFENFGSEAGKIAFSINGCKTVKEGKLTLADGAFPVIDAGKNLRIAYTAKVATPALAISFAHFFVGLTCIISQRNIMKQIFGYCLMENGSHVTLALLAPTAPEIIEIGIATDAIFAVIIMSIVVRRIWDDSHSLDARDLSELRG